VPHEDEEEARAAIKENGFTAHGDKEEECPNGCHRCNGFRFAANWPAGVTCRRNPAKYVKATLMTLEKRFESEPGWCFNILKLGNNAANANCWHVLVSVSLVFGPHNFVTNMYVKGGGGIRKGGGGEGGRTSLLVMGQVGVALRSAEGFSAFCADTRVCVRGGGLGGCGDG